MEKVRLCETGEKKCSNQRNLALKGNKKLEKEKERRREKTKETERNSNKQAPQSQAPPSQHLKAWNLRASKEVLLRWNISIRSNKSSKVLIGRLLERYLRLNHTIPDHHRVMRVSYANKQNKQRINNVESTNKELTWAPISSSLGRWILYNEVSRCYYWNSIHSYQEYLCLAGTSTLVII